MTTATYSADDTVRYLTEEPGNGGARFRNSFTRDRARVLHSAGFRRLAAITQVVTAGEDDFPRTRLTHSLEVAQIGRELAAALGCDPEIVDTAGLAHDLGHPPFGHNGEEALNALAAKCGGFEGNAQTLRVLTRLEPKVIDEHGSSVGLNLTRATLDATVKYPWSRAEAPMAHPGLKFGLYPDDVEIFGWIRAASPGRRRCLEAQVMEWADDVAYSVHDLEDGVHAGHIQLRILDDPAERVALCTEAARREPTIGPSVDLAEILDDLLALPALAGLVGYDGSHRSQAVMKQMTSALVGRMVSAAIKATKARFSERPLNRYEADLIVPERSIAECALLKSLAMRYVMGRPGMAQRYARQRELLATLVGWLAERAPDGLDVVFRRLWSEAGDDADRWRVIIDQVASLTDRSVVTWHDRAASQGLGFPD